MNKTELIEKAVLLFDGKWIFPFKNLCTPAETNTCCAPHSKFESIRNVSELGPHWVFICTEEEFNAAADRMRASRTGLWLHIGQNHLLRIVAGIGGFMIQLSKWEIKYLCTKLERDAKKQVLEK